MWNTLFIQSGGIESDTTSGSLFTCEAIEAIMPHWYGKGTGSRVKETAANWNTCMFPLIKISINGDFPEKHKSNLHWQDLAACCTLPLGGEGVVRQYPSTCYPHQDVFLKGQGATSLTLRSPSDTEIRTSQTFKKTSLQQ